MAVVTSKSKLTAYIEQDLLNWFQGYCKEQSRTMSSQVTFMIQQLKKESEKGDHQENP